MPSPAEVAANVAMMAFVVGAVHYLRARQPDPNPAIEAREAAKEAARQAAALADGTPGDEHARADHALQEVAPAEDRRHDPLPYVGIDRREAELTQTAAVWRRNAPSDDREPRDGATAPVTQTARDWFRRERPLPGCTAWRRPAGHALPPVEVASFLRVRQQQASCPPALGGEHPPVSAVALHRCGAGCLLPNRARHPRGP